MGPEEGDYIETVLTCEGDFYDPDFHSHLHSFSQRLQNLIVTDKKELILKKVEPWNSVRVTFNIPRDAAHKLKLLAEQGDNTLKELGILAVQIEGDKIISLTIAGKNNETTELVFDFESSEHVSPGSRHVDATSRNIAAYLSQQGMDSLFGRQTKAGQAVVGKEVPLPPQLGKTIAAKPSGSKSPSYTPSHTPPFSYPMAQSPVAPTRNSTPHQNPANFLSPQIAAELARHLGQSGSLSNLPKAFLNKTLSSTSPLLVNLLQNESQGAHLNNFTKLALLESALGMQAAQPVKKRRRQRKPKATVSKDTAHENSVHSSSNDANPEMFMSSVAEQRVPPLPLVPGLNGQLQQPVVAPPSCEAKITSAPILNSGLIASTSNSSIPAPGLDAGIRYPSFLKETSTMLPTVTGLGPTQDHVSSHLNPITGQFEPVKADIMKVNNSEELRKSPRLPKGIDNVGSLVQLDSGKSACSTGNSMVGSPKISQSQVVSGIDSSTSASAVHQIATSSVMAQRLTNTVDPLNYTEALAMPRGIPLVTGGHINSTNSISAMSIADIGLIRTVAQKPNQISYGQQQPPAPSYMFNQCDAPLFSHSVAHTAVNSSIVSMESSRIVSQTLEGVPREIPNGPLGLTKQCDTVPFHNETSDNNHAMQPGTNSESSPADSGVSSTMVQSNTPNAQVDSRSPTSEISQESFSVGKDPLSDLDENRSTDSENKLSPKLNLNSLVTQSSQLGDVTISMHIGSNIAQGLVTVAKPSITKPSFTLAHPVPSAQVGKTWNCDFSPPLSNQLNSVNIKNHSPTPVCNGPAKSETETLQNSVDSSSILSDSNRHPENTKDNLKSVSDLKSNALTVGVALDQRQASLPPGVLMDKILSSKQSDYFHDGSVSFLSNTGTTGVNKLDSSDATWRVQLDSYIDEAYGIPKAQLDGKHSLTGGQLKLKLKCTPLESNIEVISRSADSLELDTLDHSELVNGNSLINNVLNGTADHVEEVNVLKVKDALLHPVKADCDVTESPQMACGALVENDGASEIPRFPELNESSANQLTRLDSDVFEESLPKSVTTVSSSAVQQKNREVIEKAAVSSVENDSSGKCGCDQNEQNENIEANKPLSLSNMSVSQGETNLQSTSAVLIGKVTAVPNYWYKIDSTVNSQTAVKNTEPRTLPVDSLSTSFSANETSSISVCGVTHQPVETASGVKDLQPLKLKHSLDVGNKMDNSQIPVLVPSLGHSEEIAFKANCVSVPVSSKWSCESDSNKLNSDASVEQNIDQVNITHGRANLLSEFGTKGIKLAVTKSTKGTSPKRDYATGFIHKSKRTPALTNSQHSIISSHYPLNLTESVQKLLKPLETTPISVSIDLTKTSDTINSNINPICAVNCSISENTFVSAINKTTESAVTGSASDTSLTCGRSIENNHDTKDKFNETSRNSEEKHSPVNTNEEPLDASLSDKPVDICEVKGTPEVRSDNFEVQVVSSEDKATINNLISNSNVINSEVDKSENMNKSDTGKENYDTADTSSLLETANPLNAVTVSTEDTSDIQNSALSPELTESLKRHSYSSPNKDKVDIHAMVVKTDDTPSDDSKDFIGANISSVEGVVNKMVLVEQKEIFKQTSKPESSQTGIIDRSKCKVESSLVNNGDETFEKEILIDGISDANSFLSVPESQEMEDIESIGAKDNADHNVAADKQVISDSVQDDGSKKAQKSLRQSRMRQPPAISENDCSSERRSTRGWKRKIVNDHLPVLDIKKPCNPIDPKCSPELFKESDVDTGNMVEPIHIVAKGKKHVISKGPASPTSASKPLPAQKGARRKVSRSSTPDSVAEEHMNTLEMQSEQDLQGQEKVTSAGKVNMNQVSPSSTTEGRSAKRATRSQKPKELFELPTSKRKRGKDK